MKVKNTCSILVSRCNGIDFYLVNLKKRKKIELVLKSTGDGITGSECKLESVEMISPV
jgi:hypothetical protein